MPRLPKDIKIVLVSENEEYSNHMASMMNQMGLKTRILQGGFDSWKWSFESPLTKILPQIRIKKAFDTNQDLFLLDVREPDEFAEWNIEGSHNIPLVNSSNSLDQIPLNKKIITICPHGNRAKIAKFIMQPYRYDNQSFAGGLKA